MLKVVNTHTLPKLNLDTFCMISSHIRSTGVMFQFMLTCHGIFNAGVPYLIKLGPFLTSPNAIASFHKFMADDDKRRYKWLKTLKLDLGDSAEATDRLLEILSNAHTLKRLEIRNCLLLDRDERIRQAIASLTTLKEIKLLRMSVISSAHAMLLEMESDVVNLEVSFFSETGNFIDGEAVIGLQKFAHCAISLHLWVAEFIHCPEEIDTSEYPVYPQVKTLVLDNARVDRLQLLTHAFPNLRSLTVINIDNARGSLEEEEPEGVEEVRDINRVDQEEMAWEALDYCYGNVNNLYTLGMISKIQRLDLSRVVIRDEAEIEQLRAVVTDALPQSLVLHVAAEFEMNALRNALFVALDDLLDFTLIVDIVEAPSSDIDPASVVACIDETIEMLFSILQASSIERLVFTMLWPGGMFILPPGSLLRWRGHEVHLAIAQRFRQLEMQYVARQAMEHAPSLRYIVTSFPSFPRSFWKVEVNDEGNRSVKTMNYKEIRDFLTLEDIVIQPNPFMFPSIITGGGDFQDDGSFESESGSESESESEAESAAETEGHTEE